VRLYLQVQEQTRLVPITRGIIRPGQRLSPEVLSDPVSAYHQRYYQTRSVPITRGIIRPGQCLSPEGLSDPVSAYHQRYYQTRSAPITRGIIRPGQRLSPEGLSDPVSAYHQRDYQTRSVPNTRYSFMRTKNRMISPGYHDSIISTQSRWGADKLTIKLLSKSRQPCSKILVTGHTSRQHL